MSGLPFTQRLAIARQLVAAGPSDRGFAPHVQDQLEAAADECKANLSQLGIVVALAEPARGWRQRRSRDDDQEQRAYLLASLLDCMSMRCPHLRKGSSPQPTFALLPLRRLDCRRCVGIRRLPPPEDGDRCDVCGARGIATFFPFAVAAGATLLSGEACPSCAGVLDIRVAAA